MLRLYGFRTTQEAYLPIATSVTLKCTTATENAGAFGRVSSPAEIPEALLLWLRVPATTLPWITKHLDEALWAVLDGAIRSGLKMAKSAEEFFSRSERKAK